MQDSVIITGNVNEEKVDAYYKRVLGGKYSPHNIDLGKQICYLKHMYNIYITQI